MTEGAVSCFACHEEFRLSSYEDRCRPFTYGRICPQCASKFHSRLGWDGHSLEAFFDAFKSPVFIVDFDGAVKAANTAARKSLGEAAHDIGEMRLGDVLECVYARLPGGCGKTVHCEACALRRALLDAAESVNTGRLPPVRFTRSDSDGAEDTACLISVEKAGDFALLHLEREGDAPVQADPS